MKLNARKYINYIWKGNINKICRSYKMSIIYNKVLDLYVLWTRWGTFGEEGQHQRTPYLTKEEAVAEFKSIFRSKTSNAWEDLSLFEAKPGKYDLLKESKHPKDTLLNDFDFMASSTPSCLPSGILNVMKLICNYQYLSKVYKDTMIDMPLGQVPQKRIEEARQLLMEAKDLNNKLNVARKNYNDKSQIQLAKCKLKKCIYFCISYFIF